MEYDTHLVGLFQVRGKAWVQGQHSTNKTPERLLQKSQGPVFLLLAIHFLIRALSFCFEKLPQSGGNGIGADTCPSLPWGAKTCPDLCQQDASSLELKTEQRQRDLEE